MKTIEIKHPKKGKLKVNAKDHKNFIEGNTKGLSPALVKFFKECEGPVDSGKSLSKMNKAELVAKAVSVGLEESDVANRSNADMIKAIEAKIEADKPAPAVNYDDEDLPQLKELCKAAGFDDTDLEGKDKAELVALLKG